MKPRNRRHPGRPSLPWTAARATECYGSVRPALRSDRRTTQLLSQLLRRTESQRQCPRLHRWETTESEKKKIKKKIQLSAQLHLPALDLFCAKLVGPAPPPSPLLLSSPGPAKASNFFVRVQPTSLLLISPGLGIFFHA